MLGWPHVGEGSRVSGHGSRLSSKISVTTGRYFSWVGGVPKLDRHNSLSPFTVSQNTKPAPLAFPLSKSEGRPSARQCLPLTLFLFFLFFHSKVLSCFSCCHIVRLSQPKLHKTLLSPWEASSSKLTSRARGRKIDKQKVSPVELSFNIPSSKNLLVRSRSSKLGYLFYPRYKHACRA